MIRVIVKKWVFIDADKNRQKQTKTDKKQIETAEEEISAVKFYLIEF